ncbi:hypothetical protein HOD19_04555 [bacterium]|jgi:hypothetical protein|nr:hypothetical protein [bacterium]MBT4649015.1 hypothetical protein [bacterium]
MKKVLLTVFALLFVPSIVLGAIGVGVGTGKIIVDGELHAGTIYQVDPVTVLNTGDEPSDYELAITYHSDQQEMWPDGEWFSFSPSTFHLKPGEVKVVDINLNIPIKAVPGNYFAFVEAHPVVLANTTGGARINVAAATKFYFSIAPDNIFQGMYYRILSLFHNSAPWGYIILAVIVMAILLTIFKKHFKFNLSVKRK